MTEWIYRFEPAPAANTNTFASSNSALMFPAKGTHTVGFGF
jgi:hypothetical protein